MHIVFISWWWPYPANNGAKLRIYHLLRELARRYDVSLLSFAEASEATPEQVAHMRTFCRAVEVVPKPEYQPSSLKATMGYLSRWPRSLIDVYSADMAARLNDYVSGQPAVDVVIASELQTLRYLDVAPHIPGILEEIEVTGFHNRVNAASGPAGRVRAQLTLTKLENALRRLMQRGIPLTVASDAERDFMRQIAPPGAVIDVIPNGVDTHGLKPDDRITPQPHTLIYTGAVTYDANEDAVRYFVGDVLPRLRQRVPDVTFSVTGGTGSVDVSDLKQQPGVNFTGYLDSVADAVRASWATVIPLRQGGGTRLKILEAMALGTPVISTRKGAEGIHVTPGENILLADDPDELVAAIDRLFNDAPLRARLVAGGRALVERDYDWPVIGQRLINLVENIAK